MANKTLNLFPRNGFKGTDTILNPSLKQVLNLTNLRHFWQHLGQICRLCKHILLHQTHRFSNLHDSGSSPVDWNVTLPPRLLSKLLLVLPNQPDNGSHKNVIQFSDFFLLLYRMWINYFFDILKSFLFWILWINHKYFLKRAAI